MMENGKSLNDEGFMLFYHKQLILLKLSSCKNIFLNLPLCMISGLFLFEHCFN